MTNKQFEGAARIVQSAVCRTNVFHRPNPSLFYFPGLSTQPIWPTKLFQDVADVLRQNHDAIVEEYLALSKKKSDYSTEGEDQHKKLHQGSWDWHSYIQKGKRQVDFAITCPQTVSVLETIPFPQLMMGTPFSFTFFSTMHPNTSIAAHNGPCNLRLRCHYPLILPSGGDFGMRVGDKTVKWQPKEPIFFDDSYEHEVWNRTTEQRVILLFDMWHPDLVPDEIAAIQDMFEEAKSKGWMK